MRIGEELDADADVGHRHALATVLAHLPYEVDPGLEDRLLLGVHLRRDAGGIDPAQITHLLAQDRHGDGVAVEGVVGLAVELSVVRMMAPAARTVHVKARLTPAKPHFWGSKVSLRGGNCRYQG